MNTIHYLILVGIVSGIIGSLLTGLISSYVRSNLGTYAEKFTSPRGKFDEIECRRLTVVDRYGKAGVILASDAPYIFGQDRMVRNSRREWIVHDYENDGVIIYGNENCGSVIVRNKRKTKCHTASLFASERGGSVRVLDNDEPDKSNFEGVELIIDEHGGYVVASGKGKGAANMGINEYGNGTVSTWDKNGNRQ